MEKRPHNKLVFLVLIANIVLAVYLIHIGFEYYHQEVLHNHP